MFLISNSDVLQSGSSTTTIAASRNGLAHQPGSPPWNSWNIP